MEKKIECFLGGIHYIWIFEDLKLSDFCEQIVYKKWSNTDGSLGTYCVYVKDFNQMSNVTLEENVTWVHTKKASLKIYNNIAYCYVDTKKIREPESLFYFLVYPLIIHVSALYHMVYFHAACLEINGKGVLLLGNRNTGKTTISLCALFNGYRFLTDDCVLVNSLLFARTIYRPMHLLPNSISQWNIENKYFDNEPYMKDVREVNFYPEKKFPDQILVSQKIDMIVWLQKADDMTSEIVKVSECNVKNAILRESMGYLNANSYTSKLKDIVSKLVELPVYQISFAYKSNDECIKLIDQITKNYEVYYGEK